MNRANTWWLLGSVFLLPLESLADNQRTVIDSRQIEAGVYRIQRFDRDSDYVEPASDTRIFLYGRTNAKSVFAHRAADAGPCAPGTCKGKLTYDVEGGLDLGLQEDASQVSWAGASIYYPIWLDERIMDSANDGAFDPDMLPPITFGLSTKAVGIKAGANSGNRAEWELNPFLRVHKWWNPDECKKKPDDIGRVELETCYRDFTGEIGADIIQSSDEDYERWDWYGAVEFRLRPPKYPRFEGSFRSHYVDTSFDKSTFDDETTWNSEVNFSFNLTGRGRDCANLYFDIALGYEDIDADSYSGSSFYTTPSIYWQYAPGARPSLMKYSRTSRSSRRGIWFR